MHKTCLALVLMVLGSAAASAYEEQRKSGDAAKVARVVVTSSNGPWTRITGRATVVNAYTLRLEDDTLVDLRFTMDAPEPDQMGLVGNALYPCGRESAEFLAKLIGDKPVTLFIDGEIVAGKQPAGPCFGGEIQLQLEMVRNGWAVSAHSGMDAWELIAREHKRGLWRGRFVAPKRWRKGERLPGEEPALAEDPDAARKSLEALRELEPVVKLDEGRPGKPVVAIHFLPNFGKVTDEHLAHLKAFPHLRSVEIPNKKLVTDAGLAHLAELDQLDELVLNGTAVSAEAIVQFLRGRTRLVRLVLAQVPLRDQDLSALVHLTELRD
jgi:endonuclease YncB( thermonuclease family)